MINYTKYAFLSVAFLSIVHNRLLNNFLLYSCTSCGSTLLLRVWHVLICRLDYEKTQRCRGLQVCCIDRAYCSVTDNMIDCHKMLIKKIVMLVPACMFVLELNKQDDFIDEVIFSLHDIDA